MLAIRVLASQKAYKNQQLLLRSSDIFTKTFMTDHLQKHEETSMATEDKSEASTVNERKIPEARLPIRMENPHPRLLSL